MRRINRKIIKYFDCKEINGINIKDVCEKIMSNDYNYSEDKFFTGENFYKNEKEESQLNREDC